MPLSEQIQNAIVFWILEPNELVLPKREGMTGTEAQCTVPGGNVVSGMVVQVVACDGDEYHAVAIEGASPLLPLSWLLLLAGWKYLPKVDQGKIKVSVQSPEGIETELAERSKMHYLDQDTFWAVLSFHQRHVFEPVEDIVVGPRGST